MKNQIRSMMAICSSLLAGMIVSSALPGCQPPPSKNPIPPQPPVKQVAPEAPAEKPTAEEAKPAETKAETPAPVTEKKPEESAAKPEPKPSEKSAPLPETKPEPVVEKPKETATAAPVVPTKNPVLSVGDWNQWGGSSIRNNVPALPSGAKIPTEWAPGEFDRKTGEWKPETAKNIKWVAALGSQTYGNTVVAEGKVWVGTNNSSGYLKRYPADIDLGCLVAFEEKTGKFLWQHSSEKLPTGRVHDWPLMGICCSPLVEGGRVWFVTSRGEIKCLDTEGFYDNEDDGPTLNEPARMFDLMKTEDPANDKVAPAIAALNEGKLNDDVRAQFAKSGWELPAEVEVKVKEAGKAWSFTAEIGGVPRDGRLMAAGPRLSGFKVLSPADKDEADVVWTIDMMKQFGVSQHNMCSCSVTSWGDLLFVNTSNGVHEDHKTIPAPEAPSFLCLNKHTGEVYWTNNSPRDNILHGQWSSPTVAIIGDTPQVIFGGGDGWVYSFLADTGKEGQPELLWKFDINDKEALLELGGRGTRNDIIATPVVYDNKVYFATGQDPEHGEGKGTFWCIDPTKRGDISEYLAVNAADPKAITPLPPRRVQAVIKEEGDKAIPNSNSGVVWKLTEQDWNDDGKIDDFMEKFHRAIGTCAIQNDLLFVADFSGLFFCIDAQKGKIHWTYDMLAESWGSPLILGDKVFVGDGDGDVLVFECKAEQHDPLQEVNMNNSLFSSPIYANGTLYIANKTHLFAIQPAEEGKSE